MGPDALPSSPVLDYLAGAIAGSANIVSGFPFDSVKVRLQADSSAYRGAWQCFTSIIRLEGFRSLYLGLSPQLIGGALETGVNYAVYQRMMHLTRGPALGLPDALAVPLSAGTAGFVLSFVLSPAELIKCRMQLGKSDAYHSYKGPLDCLRHLLRTEGARGLARGLPATMAREVPGNAIYFSAYTALRHLVPGRAPESGGGGGGPRSLRQQLGDVAAAVMCGGVAGVALWSAVLPLDVAKTRVQTAYPGSKHNVGLLGQLRLLWGEGRFKSLYAGLSPTLIRAFPANAAQWLAWELCIQYTHAPAL